MILTCPACATRYLVEPRALGTQGRTVRCARCAHSWYESPPEPVADGSGLPPRPAPLHGSQTWRPIPPGSNLPALIKSGRARQGRRGWLALAAVVLSAIAVTVGYRERIVEVWPPAGRLYAALQLPADSGAQAGFNVRNLASARSVREGRTVLTVSGEVVNLGPASRQVPALHLALKDRDARALKEWRERLPETSLAPGEALPFWAELADPPEDAVSLSVSVAAGG